MRTHSNHAGYRTLSFVAILFGSMFCTLSAYTEGIPQWHFSIMAGSLDYEGEEAVQDTAVLSFAAGYDLSPRWTIEGVVLVPSQLDENFRTDWSTGSKISRLEELTSPGVHSTQSARLGLSGLYHFARSATLDPYLGAGGGLIWYSDTFEHKYEAAIAGSAGLLWQLSGQWALRTEAQGFYVGTAGQFNSTVSVGLVWTPGGSSTAKPSAAAPPVVEVPKYRTIDSYELHIEFSEDSAKIPAQYNGELDVIGKSLRDHPEAIVRIASHIDQRKGSSERSAINMTGKQAKAVRDYLAGDKWKITDDRMTAIGCGFSKPKEKADPETSSSVNRRIEVNILVPIGSGHEQPTTAPSEK
ncbi:MAG: OmpA family protein [bacterium]